MAHELRRPLGQRLQQSLHSLARHHSRLRDAAKIVGRRDSRALRHFPRVAAPEVSIHAPERLASTALWPVARYPRKAKYAAWTPHAQSGSPRFRAFGPAAAPPQTIPAACAHACAHPGESEKCPAALILLICASHSRSTSSVEISLPLSAPADFPARLPVGPLHSASCVHCRPQPLASHRSNSGVRRCPVLDFPAPAATPASNARPFANREVLVTSPRRCASTIPRLTPSVQPRSSALTIKFFNLARFPVLSDSYSFALHTVFVPLTVFPSNSSMAE